MSLRLRLSVVIAVEGADANLPQILDNLSAAAKGGAEILICFTGHPPVMPPCPAARAVRLLPGSTGSRIPHLWRDGIQAATADWVATLSAHVVPDEGWLERALQIVSGDVADWAVGGSIALPESASRHDRAIHVLRYMRYTPPLPVAAKPEPAADNALYRRRALLDDAELLAAGFWEPEFHARMRARGGGLALDPRLRVWHRNRYSPRAFAAQRFDHGREYGFYRATGRPFAIRAALLLLTPVLPAVFFAKLVRGALSHPVGRRVGLSALPWLLVHLAAWGSGEARGYCDALGPRPRGPTGQGRALSG